MLDDKNLKWGEAIKLTKWGGLTESILWDGTHKDDVLKCTGYTFSAINCITLTRTKLGNGYQLSFVHHVKYEKYNDIIYYLLENEEDAKSLF